MRQAGQTAFGGRQLLCAVGHLRLVAQGIAIVTTGGGRGCVSRSWQLGELLSTHTDDVNEVRLGSVACSCS